MHIPMYPMSITAIDIREVYSSRLRMRTIANFGEERGAVGEQHGPAWPAFSRVH